VFGNVWKSGNQVSRVAMKKSKFIDGFLFFLTWRGLRSVLTRSRPEFGTSGCEA
jgi:hypothetical protein